MLFHELKISKYKAVGAAICLGIAAILFLAGYYLAEASAKEEKESVFIEKESAIKQRKMVSEETVNGSCDLSTAEVAGTNQSLRKRKKASVTGNDITLDLGECMLLPFEDRGRVISYKSSDESVASISKIGKIHALQHGKAKVEVKYKVGKSHKVKRYRIMVRKRGMVYPVFSMMKGEHLDLQFSLEDTSAVWKSKNPSVARVSKEGQIVARKKGNAIIIGESEQGKIYRCKLTVTKKVKDVIYLTFDDGPNRYSTTKVLKILKKNNVKATFFELKPAKADFDLTKRVLDEGHSLALHGYQHKYDIIYRSQKVYHNNLNQLRDLFFKKFGVWCTVSRFPGGSSNTRSRYNPGIMTKLTKKLHGWGYHYFDWNVDSGDAGGAKTAKDTFRNFKNGIRKGRSNVVLMHDFYGNDKTINALEKMIRYGKKNGYTFLPITASTGEIHHAVNN